MPDAPVSTTVTELPESRVRVEAEVPRRRGREARRRRPPSALGRNLRVPGFRKGKVAAAGDHPARRPRGRARRGGPRVDRPAGTRPRSTRASVVPVGEPDLDLDDLPDEGEPLRFSIEIGVRPTATLGEYKGLEVGRREPEVDDEAIDERDRAAARALGQARDRRAPRRDAATSWSMDFVGTLDGEPFAGGEGRDQMVELGSGRLVPGFEEQLEGASAGEERTVRSPSPRTTAPSELAGKQAEFAVTVKEVKAKELPELDDDFAAEAGFDTLDELREDIRERLAEARRRARSRPSSARPRSTPRSPTRRSRCPTRWSRRARASCGTRWLHTLGAPGHLARGVPADRGQGRGRDRGRATASPTPSATCAARPCSPPSSRPRASRPSDEELLEALERAAAAEGRLAQEAARAPALRRAALDALKARPRRSARRSITIAESAQARESRTPEHRRKGRSKRDLDAGKLRPTARLDGARAVARLAPVERRVTSHVARRQDSSETSETKRGP